MARPRVFVSSTFYDLRQVRADLEKFIRGMGFDSVLHDRGNIPYGKDLPLEDYCYREIEMVDIVVSIAGGRFGSTSKQDSEHSVAQMEAKTAIEMNKPLFIFVEKSVLAEHATYQNNRETAGVKYRFVDDIRVYRYLDELFALPRNNPVSAFETAEDITNFLREQWAGLFQRLLQEQVRLSETQAIARINDTAKTLDRLVAFLTKDRDKTDSVVREILLSSHPAFRAIAEHTNTTDRVFFTNRDELHLWLKAKGYSLDLVDDDGFEQWSREWRGWMHTLRINNSLFNVDGKLKTMQPEDWSEELITKSIDQIATTVPDDDVPF